MTDLNNLTWTLKAEPNADNNAVVHFGCDGKDQTINIPDVTSVEAVTAFLNQYTLDYVAGLQLVANTTTNAPALASLIGKVQTAPDTEN